MPLVQAQPIWRLSLADAALSEVRVQDELGPAEWKDYYLGIAEPNTRPDRAFGAYAVVERRLRRQADASETESR